jgi:signal transduction histidine kinase
MSEPPQTLPVKKGLRRRILVWFLVLSLVPLFLSNTVGYSVTSRIIERQVQRYLLALTEIEAQHVATEVERHLLYLDVVVAGNSFLTNAVPHAAAAVRAGDRQSAAVTGLHEHLDRKLAELPPLSELFVLDTGGTVVASTVHSRVGADWSYTDLFRIGRQGRFFADDLEAIGGLVGPVYRLAIPIPGSEGASVGLLAAAVGFEHVQGFLRIPPHLAGDIHTFIVDREGRPLFASHPHAGLDYGERLPSPLLGQPDGAVVRYVNYEGVEVLGTAVPVPQRSWRYIAEASVSSVFGQLRGLALLAAVLEAAFALLLVAIVWVVARSIVAPLRRLVAAAERIRAGDLGIEVEIDRPDELGDLGRTFNQMSQELRGSAHQIQELHDQEMRRAAQLASVGELASGIAHEIKNPLVGVASGLDLLAGEIGDNPRAEGFLTQMRAQLHRIESAIHDLLSYARPREPRLTWTEPRLLVDRVVQLITPQAKAAGVQIEKSVREAVPKIRVDPELLAQALVNLALNGIQVMAPGGVLTISTEHVNDEIHIAISDTGTGIPGEQLETIFRPFYTTKHQGTGLGLAITRGIVERHGGHLEVESEVGAGSTFTLVFSAPQRESVTQ